LAATIRITQLEQENALLSTELATVKQQLDWFKRQLFGEKSEKRLDIDTSVQAGLFSGLGLENPPSKESDTETITYQRRKKCRDGAVTDSGLRFGDEVPKKVFVLKDPEMEALAEDQREIIGEKVSHRLAQRPGSYLILEYRRQVYKRLDDNKIVTTAAPANVLEKSSVDVSLLAGLSIDKFCYHLPLYRQHQRLQQAGIEVSRTSLTNWTGRSIDLLRPIVDAQSDHILLSKVLAMDETPIKAGRIKKGKMRQAYLWPIYGEDDEIVFRYSPSRAHHYVQDWLKDFSGTLLSDGYEAYAAYVKHNQLAILAQCWSHTRRKFEQAKEGEPSACNEALSLIGALYRHEEIIRDKPLSRADKLSYRTQHSEPIVRAFWIWCDQQCHRLDLLPKDPLTRALKYAMNRQAGLQVFLSNPDVPIDTNHVERSLRPVPMGRKNWLFCWTEIGAERVGIIQSLLVTCKLQGVDPYTYLVDVLQRISIHPSSRVIELTPREWKVRFADNPLRSDVALSES
jgi:transposase